MKVNNEVSFDCENIDIVYGYAVVQYLKLPLLFKIRQFIRKLFKIHLMKYSGIKKVK